MHFLDNRYGECLKQEYTRANICKDFLLSPEDLPKLFGIATEQNLQGNLSNTRSTIIGMENVLSKSMELASIGILVDAASYMYQAYDYTTVVKAWKEQ